jgi:phosphoesterase RecJ-like protein
MNPSRLVTRAQVAEAIRTRQRFVIASHVRPDGDATGSQLAMAYALRALGKEVRVVSRDAPPPSLADLPGVTDVEVVSRVDDPGDAVIVMECSELARTGVDGLGGSFVINIDHHLGNTEYGAMNWLDISAASCGEMVYGLIHELGVPLTREIATHVYVTILTDTGSFHYSNITPRTFEICRECMEAGMQPHAVAHSLFNNSNLGRLRLFGAILGAMDIDPSGRLATLYVDQRIAHECGGTYEDIEGLINEPLTVKEIEAVLFFKEHGPLDWRVSMRSKGSTDINAVARQFGGGGHKNASGCSATGSLTDLKPRMQALILEQVDRAAR